MSGTQTKTPARMTCVSSSKMANVRDELRATGPFNRQKLEIEHYGLIRSIRELLASEVSPERQRRTNVAAYTIVALAAVVVLGSVWLLPLLLQGAGG